ncbi:hypothetical protein K3495_g2785 [Podosphaera aphanis]|nr:hypothetical protein K3495_g2785 [Podosphaera aphanis]
MDFFCFQTLPHGGSPFMFQTSTSTPTSFFTSSSRLSEFIPPHSLIDSPPKNTNNSLTQDTSAPLSLLTKEDIRLATELIHHRLAHVGPRFPKNIDHTILNLSNIKVKDPNIFRFDTNSLSSCDVCHSCKQVERINRVPASRSSSVLELIHSDTWVKCRVPGIYGSLYFVTFTDDASRECKVYNLKSLQEVPKCFKDYRQKKELQTDKYIKALRFDGGTEYQTINFNGITQQISAPYT